MTGRAGIYALALIALIGSGRSSVFAQPQDSDTATLRQRVERRFEILPLRDGIALRPIDAARSVRLIELTDGTIAIDGVPATGAELETKLGDDAALVLQVSYLSDAHRRSLLTNAPAPAPVPAPAPAPPSVQPPAPPVAPSVESQPRDPDGQPRPRRRSRGGNNDRVRIGGDVIVPSG